MIDESHLLQKGWKKGCYYKNAWSEYVHPVFNAANSPIGIVIRIDCSGITIIECDYMSKKNKESVPFNIQNDSEFDLLMSLVNWRLFETDKTIKIKQ